MTTHALKVVKSATPTRPPERPYADFDKWQKTEHKLEQIGDALCKAIDLLDDTDPITQSVTSRAEYSLNVNKREQIEKLLAAYEAGHAWYERDELYEKDEDGISHLSRRVIVTRIAMWLGAFPCAPHSPEVFSRHVVEEVVVDDTSNTRLELACRATVRTRKFPEIAALIEALHDRGESNDYSFGMGDLTELRDGVPFILWLYDDLTRKVAEAKASLIPPEIGTRVKLPPSLSMTGFGTVISYDDKGLANVRPDGASCWYPTPVSKLRRA
jgi:hypothetical protein